MDVVIIGAGGHGRDCHQLVDDLQADGSGEELHLIGYLDDNAALHHTEVQGLPVLGGTEWLANRKVAAVLGVGHPKVRLQVHQKASQHSVTAWPALVHPTAYVASRAQVGAGVYVGVMAALSGNCHLKGWTVLNDYASLGHDAVVEEFAMIGPYCSVGPSTIGEGTLLGQGTIITPGSTVGQWATVGANSVVLPKYPVPDHTLVMGSPALPKGAGSHISSQK